MFKKREPDHEGVEKDDYEKNYMVEISKEKVKEKVKERVKVNTILKGSRLTGDINISCDLELSGEVEGNISSEQGSNIIIKGSCKGSIKTREGCVDVEGELINGDIISGGDVKITGKFDGGKVEAKGKIYVNGEFNGKLESSEIEIGPTGRGKGELFYRQYISISKGANIDAQINKVEGEVEALEKPSDNVINFEIAAKETSDVMGS
jgi:cytoskeletal protein CcmA (bactofilin family)